MRRDLTHGCPRCAVRFSERAERCPLCGGAAAGAASLTQKPLRVPLGVAAKWAIFVPLALVVAASVVGAVTMPAMALVSGMHRLGAVAVAFFVAGAMAGFLVPLILAALPLLAWSGLVALADWAGRRHRTMRLAVCLAYADRRPTRLERLAAALEAHAPLARETDDVTGDRKGGWGWWARAAIVLVAAEGLAELLAPESLLRSPQFGSVGARIGMLLFMNVFFVGFLLMPVGIAASGIRSLAAFLLRPPSILKPRSPDVATLLERWIRPRSPVAGRVEPLRDDEAGALAAFVRERGGAVANLDELRSPISGERCPAFRLEGDCDGHEVDDAGAADFAIVGDDGIRTLVWAAEICVAFASAEELPEEPAAVSEEAAAFLLRRGLTHPAARLRETTVAWGSAVEVWGDAHRLTVPSGYRGHGELTVLRGSAQAPAVVAPRRRSSAGPPTSAA